MASLENLIKKMLRLPPEMRFEDILKVLKYFGYKCKNVTGSHYTYYKVGNKPFTIVKDGKKIKKAYIRKIKEILNMEEWYENHKK